MLGVDSKTVQKYLSKDTPKEKAQSKVNSSLLQQYRQRLLEGIKKYPNNSRTKIRERFKKEYAYLYRHDRNWLFKKLPNKRRQTSINKIVDWSARDDKYCELIKLLYEELMVLEKPVRITKSLIGKRLGMLSNLEKYLHKLPKTKKLLNRVQSLFQNFKFVCAVKLLIGCYRIRNQSYYGKFSEWVLLSHIIFMR